MNLLDLVFILLTGLWIYRGYRAGLVVSVKNTLCFFGGGFLSYFLSESFYTLFYPHWLENKSLAKILCFFVIFSLIIFIGFWLGKVLKDLISKSPFNWLDNALGGVFGVLKLLFMVFLFVSVVGYAQYRPLKEPVAQSKYVKNLYLFVRNLTDINLIEKMREWNDLKR